MESKSIGKVNFFASEIAKMTTPVKRVLDIGCCSGLIAGSLAQMFPNTEFIGLDLDQNFLMEASVNHCSPNLSFLQADALNLPLLAESVDVVYLSSTFHEIYSYPQGGFNHQNITDLLQQIYRVLRPSGRGIFRDPARPENPNEILQVTARTDDGINENNIIDLLKIPPVHLSTNSLLTRFLFEFNALGTNLENMYPTSIYFLPAWLVSEFIRHRVFTDSEGDWNSEINELYGVCTPFEFSNYVQDANLITIYSRNTYTPDNDYLYENKLAIYNARGNLLTQPERFPTHFYSVIEKQL